jgi:formamidopyrimidine-DNA glycosylase
MPELPEVESLVRKLKPLLSSKKILSTNVLWPRTVAKVLDSKLKRGTAPDPDHPLNSAASGYTFYQFKRCGKYLHFELERDGDLKHLFVHLRMSGSMQVFSESAPLRKHDRILFELSGGKRLHFQDPRKFGRMYWVDNPQEVVGHIGVDPFAAEAIDHATALFKKLKIRVKTALLRQDILAGIGNIYADECLWSARIHPLTPTNKLSKEKIKTLVLDLRKILTAAIEASGTDFGDHVVEGSFSPKVYGRTDKPCKRCKTPIERIVVGQRSTHLCSHCQKIVP